MKWTSSEIHVVQASREGRERLQSCLMLPDFKTLALVQPLERARATQFQKLLSVSITHSLIHLSLKVSLVLIVTTKRQSDKVSQTSARPDERKTVNQRTCWKY